MQREEYLKSLKIGDFKVRGKLGEGQFGRVYLV